MTGSHFIMQTSKFFNATAVTLGQGHGKVIQYISPDLYFLCPKYNLRFSANVVDVRDKIRCDSGGQGTYGSGGSGNKLKT